jgi:hypothetical protein
MGGELSTRAEKHILRCAQDDNFGVSKVPG